MKIMIYFSHEDRARINDFIIVDVMSSLDKWKDIQFATETCIMSGLQIAQQSDGESFHSTCNNIMSEASWLKPIGLPNY